MNLPSHGTEAGYQRHRRRKEKVCESCRHAKNAANMERRRLAKEEIEYVGEWVRDGLIWRPTQVAS